MGEGLFGLRWFWYAVVGIVAAAAVALVGIQVLESQADAREAQALSAGYTPPPDTGGGVQSIAVIGDSYTGGSAQNHGNNTLWWYLLAVKDGFTVQNLGIGGSGWVNAATGDRADGNFVDRVSKVSPSANVIVFFGSRNDTPDASTPAEVEAHAKSALAAAVKADPTAQIVVVGPPWTDSNAPSWITADRNAVRAAAATVHATWVDPLQQDWFPTNSGLIGSDGVHPTDRGHAVIAAKLEPVLVAALMRAATPSPTPTP